MKSIKVSDEMYTFLLDISKKMNTQDNRATAIPFMYIIQVDEERNVPDGFGETKLVSNEGVEWDLEQAKEDYEMEIRKHFKINSKETISDNMVETYLLKTDKAAEATVLVFQVPAGGLNVNTFFTEDAVRQHIKLNRYHYDNPKDYVIHTWRNPEMEMVHKFLKGLCGESGQEN